MSVYLPVLMFVMLLALLLIGIPVVYSLATTALTFTLLLWGEKSLFALVTATMGIMGSWALVAVPLFTFMSLILFETGIVEEMYDTFYQFTAGIRGGLAVCTVMVGALMGALTGVIAGTVIALTALALPQMFKYKYDKKIAMGSILAGGTLGQLIPPSTNMVLYGTMSSVSVGGLFASGISSGLFLAVLYSIYILIRSYLNKSLCPTVPPADRLSLRQNLKGLKKVIWPVVLVVAVLGSMFGGFATPTEAAAVGSVGALLIALLRRRLKGAALWSASQGTLKITAMMGYLTVAAAFFGQVFVAIGGNKFVLQMAEAIPFGSTGVCLAALGTVFFLGMFIDSAAIIVICAPIFGPLVKFAGLDPLWFGIMFMMTLQCGYLTPPFGFSLFYLKGAAPGHIQLKEVYQSALPFIAVQITGIALCLAFPVLAVWGAKIFM